MGITSCYIENTISDNTVDPTRGIPSFITTDYPNRRGFQTKSGIQIYTDDTTKTIVLKTPGGLQGKLDDTTNTITLTQSLLDLI